MRIGIALWLGVALSLAAPAPAQTAPASGPATRPITTLNTEAGKLLKQWWAEGTAAGNVGDWYDNRDGEHSPLGLNAYPQLQKIPYTDQERKARVDWALQTRVLPLVVFGNSSTSAPAHLGGSNPRRAYSEPVGLAMLYTAYTHNNLYIYPEHMDHDPGHNGNPGYGDLFPTNTPCLMISQGSSGSDLPFMRAVPLTLAAFRPEVKKKLIETGLLMPTVQMIFRSSNKHLKDPADYLTAKAHPTVFEGSWVDELKMVKAAHAMTLEGIPAMVQLRVEEEDAPVSGRDFFERPGLTEKLGDTPAVVARVWRGAGQSRRMVLSAANSKDLHNRPLKFEWALLRGDEAKVQIRKLDDAGTRVELTVKWHGRRPIAPDAAMESNRIDVGVFAHNGAAWSAPAFVTFFELDDEARAYDPAGRVIEIGYGAGAVGLAVKDWSSLLESITETPEQPTGMSLLQKAFTAEQQAELAKAGKEYRSTTRPIADAQQKAKAAKGEEARAAQAEVDKLQKAADAVLTTARPGLDKGARAAVEAALRPMITTPSFFNDNRQVIESAAKADPRRQSVLNNARKRLTLMGIARDGIGPLELTPLRPGGDLTACERCELERFNGEVLQSVLLPNLVQAPYRPNYVDFSLSSAKTWRDIYRYDGDKLLGWTRYGGPRPQEFTPDGELVVEKDADGRPTQTRKVRYTFTMPRDNQGRPLPWNAKLQMEE